MPKDNYSDPFQYGQLWYKYLAKGDGSRHLLVSATPESLETASFKPENKSIGGVAHDHYILKNGQYYVQLRTNNSTVHTTDKKGHLYRKDTPFPADAQLAKTLSILFNQAETIVAAQTLKAAMNKPSESIERLNENPDKRPPNTGNNGGKSAALSASYLATRATTKQELVQNFSAANLMLSQVHPSDTQRAHHAKEDALFDMNRQVQTFRTQVQELWNKLAVLYNAYKEGGIWYDTRNNNYGIDYLEPIRTNLVNLINVAYDEFETILIQHIANAGEIYQTYSTAQPGDDLGFYLLNLTPPQDTMAGLLSLDDLDNFGNDVHAFSEELVAEANQVINLYNQQSVNEEWDDIQHANYGGYFENVIAAITAVVESVEQGETALTIAHSDYAKAGIPQHRS